jgi:hypothetical protein
MGLTTHIEAGFQRQFTTGAVFVDLTSVYDTVRRDGLPNAEVLACCPLLEAVQSASKPLFSSFPM